MMIDEPAILALVDLIYQAAIDPAKWPEALVRLADLTQAFFPAILASNASERGVSGFAPRTEPDALRAYGDYWVERNPLLATTNTFAPFQVYSIESVMGRSAFKRTDIYSDWWQPAGMGTHALGTNVLVDDGTPTILGVFRPHGADDFTPEEIRLFEVAARHVARAIGISRLISLANVWREMDMAAIEGVPNAAVVVDARGAVLGATPRARRQFEAGGLLCLAASGLSITGHPGLLERLIESCSSVTTRAIRGGTCTVRKESGGPVEITVTPLRTPESTTTVSWLDAVYPVAMIFIVDPELERQQMATMWRETFGLTAAEVRLALEIVKGGGRRASAVRAGVSDATARTHLSHIFAKTGTNRQAELVACLLRTAASHP